MSLSIPYETVEEAEMRLVSTVVMYDGDPVYITKVGNARPGDPKEDILRVYAHPLPFDPHKLGDIEARAAVKEKEEMRKFISSRKFDMKTIKMGFMNIKGELLYCSRKPARQFKQGVSNNTFVSQAITGGARALNLVNAVGLKEFADMLKGVYPTFDEAVRTMNKGKITGVAFHRQFALVRDPALPELLYLYHKSDKVGVIFGGNKIILTKGMICLRESLQEIGLNVEV
jgi:hypothetical protein